MIEHASLDPYL